MIQIGKILLVQVNKVLKSIEEMHNLPNTKEVKLDLIRSIDQKSNTQLNIKDIGNNNDDQNLDASQISSNRLLNNYNSQVSFRNKNLYFNSVELIATKDKDQSEEISNSDLYKKMQQFESLNKKVFLLNHYFIQA